MSPEKLSSVVQTAKDICSSAGVRFTEKRQKVLEVLIDSPKPLSAYELIDQYQLSYKEEIQAMSVYRILEFLKEELESVALCCAFLQQSVCILGKANA